MTSGDGSSPADPWDAARYQANARFVPELGAPVMALLDPQPRERVLDLGCGDGRLTAELAARGSTVRGVDASPAMVEAARKRGLEASVMDGAALDFEGGFDAVFSNAALHWMHPPESVIDGVWRALEPGGASWRNAAARAMWAPSPTPCRRPLRPGAGTGPLSIPGTSPSLKSTACCCGREAFAWSS